MDAEELERRTQIPASWWLAQARERRVPFRKIGRYVRFDVDEVFETPKGTFESLAEEKLAAKALLKARLGEVGSNVYVPPEDRLTFREVAKLWSDSKVGLCAASLSDYQTTLTLDCYLVPYFGPRKYASITRLDIERFRAEMVVGVPESVQRARDENRPSGGLRPCKTTIVVVLSNPPACVQIPANLQK